MGRVYEASGEDVEKSGRKAACSPAVKFAKVQSMDDAR